MAKPYSQWTEERKEKHRERVRCWQAENPERVRKHRQRWRAKNKDKIRAYSAARYALPRRFATFCGCLFCGFRAHWVALDYHHLIPEDKGFCIAAPPKGWHRAIMKREMRKCVVLCANCHRRLHSGDLKITDAILPERCRKYLSEYNLKNSKKD